MSEYHDNSTISNSNKDTELERTSSNQHKVHYTHDQKKFIKVFPELIQEASTLGQVCPCNLERDVLWQGKIYPTAFHICFYGKIFAKAAKVTIHFKDITLIEKRSTVGMFPNAIRINTANIEYVFSSFLKRDVTYQAFCDAWHRVKSSNEIAVNEQFNLNGISKQQDIVDPIDREINGHKKSNSVDQIDAGVFSNEEQKKIINEGDDTIFSQSYPEPSPIEKALQSQEYEMGGLNEPTNSQLPNEGHQNKMLDEVYNIDSKSLYQFLFEDNSKFLYDVYKDANNDNIKIGLWKKDARTNLKERIIMYNSLNKALFSSRGNILTEEKQKFLKNNKDNIFIESEIRVLNINYGDYFKIICKYFIIAERDDYSRLLITFEIKFTKKLALTEKIEKTMFDNYTKLFIELENHLNKALKKVTNEEVKVLNMSSTEELNTYAEPLSSSFEKLSLDQSLEGINDKGFKSDSVPPISENMNEDMEKKTFMDQFFNAKIARTSFFNYTLDAVFLIFSILIQIPTIIIHIMNFIISLFKQHKHASKKKGTKDKDEKKILTHAPYLIVFLSFLLLVGIIITVSNAYYARQLKQMEDLIKNKQVHKINPAFLSKLNDELNNESNTASSDKDIMESLLGSSYKRYNDILERYNKQKNKHSVDFDLSYLRLNQQLDLMSQKFEIMKTDVENIKKDFSNENLVNLIKELEKQQQEEQKNENDK